MTFTEEDAAGIEPTLTTALVTDNVDPQGHNRLKIQYPWDSDQNESYWARVLTFMSGNGFGAHFIPEVGDEVLVSFLNGDIENPIIMGALWNDERISPYDNLDKKNNIRSIMSRSGHEIVFDDSESGGKIEIKSQSGHHIILDDSAGGEKITMEDKSGNSIEMDAVANKITLKSSMQLSIESNIIEIKADSMLTLKGAIVKIN